MIVILHDSRVVPRRGIEYVELILHREICVHQYTNESCENQNSHSTNEIKAVQDFDKLGSLKIEDCYTVMCKE